MKDLRIIDLTREDFKTLFESIEIVPLAKELQQQTDRLLQKLMLEGANEEQKKEIIEFQKREEEEHKKELKELKVKSILVSSKLILLERYFEENGFFG